MKLELQCSEAEKHVVTNKYPKIFNLFTFKFKKLTAMPTHKVISLSLLLVLVEDEIPSLINLTKYITGKNRAVYFLHQKAHGP